MEQEIKHKIAIRQFVFSSLNPWRLEGVLEKSAWDNFEKVLIYAPKLLDRRVLWNVNSTAAGGGAAEMLGSLLPYFRGTGVDVRWMVILAKPAFFEITKRLHNFLHGVSGDNGELEISQKDIYEKTTHAAAMEMAPLVQPQDVIILHDPQTAGMIPTLKKRGATIIWRCHIGTDHPNSYVERGWAFLEPYLNDADAYIYTRASYVPKTFNNGKVKIIAPSIDPFSPKNQDMDQKNAEAILSHVGILRASIHERSATRHYFRMDGSPARVDRICDVLRAGPPPDPSTPVIIQVSRWDRLKDPVGVINCFAKYIAQKTDAFLCLAGPSVQYVADDPEGTEVLQETEKTWRSIQPDIRARIILASIPMRDLEENAAIVNALQRHASIIVQKSLREGFGLTVTEAMWKSIPVVGSRVGGIPDQIAHGKSGLLLNDPSDLKSFGNIINQLLKDPSKAKLLGKKGKSTVYDRFLFNRHLQQYLDLIRELIS